MAFIRNLLLFCAISLVRAAATPLDSSIQVRNAPGDTVEDTYRAIRRGLAVASLEKRQDFKAELPLEKSWSGATLLFVNQSTAIPQTNQNTNLTVDAGIKVTCQTCYVKGLATAKLTINGDFNASQLIEETVDSVSANVQNFTNKFDDQLLDYAKGVIAKFEDGFDKSDFNFPTMDLAFDLEIPEIPQTNLRIQFDDLELYLELNTVISAGATYQINLFATQTPIEIKLGSVLQLGAVLSVDLILAVEGAIDISSGFHIKLDDGVALDIALFGDKVSNIDFNGGQFEFLPVTLTSASGVISAVLRVSAHCGIEVGQSETSDVKILSHNIGLPSLKSGIEVAVFANVAEFITNITYNKDDKECELEVVQEYNLAVGAIAGASVVAVFLDETKTWGPVAGTSTAIFTTTVAKVCAMEATASAPQASITPAPERRQDLTKTTISTVITTSGISCKVSGLANCPNSEQVTVKTKYTTTLITSVPSGVEATFPATTSDTVQSTVPFGSRVSLIKVMSGSPTPYVAPPNDHDGEVGGASKKVAIGVSLGLVIPILAAIIGGILFIRRRKRYAAVHPAAQPMVFESYTSQSG
ncbi:hypothetical protein EJ02DRAFT_504179 [Clathrospora elynae]|uniref:Mid2 domain-containing protein n=1 Tax=Clathrospora elynae TaxID=706981 RepID=A0A6A5SL05_9PLEO|nr:hypothetical protein EJ02DRAFT_504179 [Clathrospora elynae]